MDSIRLDSGVKKIEVNDFGEYITVNLSNNQFFDQFRLFVLWLDEAQKAIEEKAAQIEQKYADEPQDEVNIHKVVDSMMLYKELSDEISSKLDGFFGTGCLRKVFPDVESPGMDLIYDFLDAVTPYLQKYAQEHGAKFDARYNRSRKGARSK